MDTKQLVESLKQRAQQHAEREKAIVRAEFTTIRELAQAVGALLASGVLKPATPAAPWRLESSGHPLYVPGPTDGTRYICLAADGTLISVKNPAASRNAWAPADPQPLDLDALAGSYALNGLLDSLTTTLKGAQTALDLKARELNGRNERLESARSLLHIVTPD